MLRNIIGATALGLTLAGCVTTTTTYSSSNKSVDIVNATGITMTNFYGSNAGTNSWEEDILGVSTLASGSSASINFEDGSGFCTFDFKAVFADGDVVIEEGINVCTTSTFTFY